MNQSKAIRFLLSSVLRELNLRVTDADSVKVCRLLDELSIDIEKVEVVNSDGASIKIKQAQIHFDKGCPPQSIPLSEFQFYKRGLGSVDDNNWDQNRVVGYKILWHIAEQKHGAEFSARLKAVSRTELQVKAQEPSASSRWVLGLSVFFLALVSFLVALFQGQRTFNFVDGTYLIENLYRLHSGEQPYRDFFLVLPPVHYYLHGSFFTLFGGHAGALLYSGALVHALTVVLTFFAVRHWTKNLFCCVVLAALVIPGGMARLCFPLYDSDAGLIFIALVNVALTWEKKEYHRGWGVLTGVLCAILTLTKYNIGLPVFAGFILLFFGSKLLYKTFQWKHSASFFLGYLGFIGGLCLLYSSADMLQPFIYQTLEFPRQQRLSFFNRLFAAIHPGHLIGELSNFQFHYSRMIWRLLILVGCVLPFVKWLTGTHPRPFKALILIPTMGFVLGAMQSQVLGSTYGIYPAAVLILVNLYSFLFPISKRLAQYPVGLMILCFMFSTSYEAVNGTRLYFLMTPFEDPKPFQLSALEGLSVTNKYRESFEQVVEQSERLIPSDEAVFFWPGDAPFYYATNRRCPLKNFQVMTATGMGPARTIKRLDSEALPWLIIRNAPHQQKARLQLRDPYIQSWLSKNYKIIYAQDGFLIGKRKQ